MISDFFKQVRGTIKHWYLPLIVGLILILMGLWTIKEPEKSYVALAILFSLTFVFSGFFETLFAISNRKIIDNWGWNLVMGLITLVIGIIMFIRPEISMATLPFYVGFVILFRSMNAIAISLDLKNYGVLDWGNIMALGIVGLVFAVILLWNPFFAGMSIVIWTGIALIMAGIINIMVSVKLKKIHDVPKKISKALRDKFEELEKEMIEEMSKTE